MDSIPYMMIELTLSDQ